jgi:hypothetical protein
VASARFSEFDFYTQRDSDMTSEEFINSLVDYRMQAVSAQRELSTTDYEAVSDDGIFVKSLVILHLKLLMRRLQQTKAIYRATLLQQKR